MTPFRLAIAATVLSVAATLAGGAAAQQPAPQQEPQQESGGQPGWGMGPGMMGPGMMGPGMMGRGMMGYGGMGPWMMGWRGRGSMCTAMAGHIDGRLAYLKAELKITAAQGSLWDAYAAAARQNAGSMLAHCNAMMGQRRSTEASLPERLDEHERLMAAQLETVKAMNKALKPLYAALTDSQKKTADDLFWGHMGMMW